MAKENKTKDVAIYVRTSCDHSKHLYQQILVNLEEAFTSIKPYSGVLKLYIDFNKSGTNEAAALSELLNDIEEKKIHTLYVTDYARMSRNVDKLQEIIDLTKKHKVTINFTN